MAIRNIRRQATNPLAAPGTPTSSPIYVDSDDNKLKIIPASSGTTELEVPAIAALATITGDGAIALTSGTTLLTKGSAAAITIAAPGTNFANLRITIIAGSNFAHVVTFTGSTLLDGTTGANITWTSAAFIGSSITVQGLSATTWGVESFNLGTIA